MDDRALGDESAGIAPAGWPKVVGILSLVFGILGLTCGVLGIGAIVGMDAFFGSMIGGQLPPGTPPPPFTPPLDALMIGTAIFGFLVNGLLIFAAAQLLKRHQAGRSLHLAYAVVGVVAAFLGSFAGYQGQQAQTAQMSSWIEQHGDSSDFGKEIKRSQQQQAQMQGPMQMISLFIGLALTLAWPVFCIVWFGIVKQAVPPAIEYD